MGQETPLPAASLSLSADSTTDPIVIVGNGPVGVHLLNELQRRAPRLPVVILGREESQPYNRVALSSLLQGEVALETLVTPLPEGSSVTCRSGTDITAIDTGRREVIDHLGYRYRYAKLVLALGSTPHVPGIPGRSLAGVYTLRNLRDAEHLRSRHVRSRHCVVIGGGLLGLEAARGMQRYGTRVTLIHHAPYLMNRQLDHRTAGNLESRLRNKDLTILIQTAVTRIEGNERVESVRLRNGDTIPCDTLVFATGIRPNVELARKAGLSVGRGIRVDDHLQTSVPDIYAIGECAEHRGEIYGLVAPGLEQAAALALYLTGQAARYTGSLLASTLKVNRVSVHSAGSVNEYSPGMIDCSVRYRDSQGERSLKLYRGRLVGACGVGPWPGFARIQDAVASSVRIWPWQRWRFSRTGELYPHVDPVLPDQAILCNCRQLSVAQVRAAFSPEMTADQLCEASGASQVCGSCRPLVAQLTATPVSTEPVAKVPVFAGLAALCYLLLFALLPAFPVPTSVEDSPVRQLWTDNLARQWTGYALLGLVTLSMVVTLFKRGPRSLVRHFRGARNAHLLLTLAMALLLWVHTGLQRSNNLNFALLSSAVALVALGGLTSLLAGLEPRFPTLRLKAWKRRLGGWHLYAAWPLPVLLAFHILSVYYF